MTRRSDVTSLNLRPRASRHDSARAAQFFLEGSRTEALETGRTRLLVAGAVFALAFLVVG